MTVIMMQFKFNNIRYFAVCLCLAVVLCPFGAAAQLRLPKLCSDHMVLQRNAAVALWGWAGSSKEIQIQFKDKTFTCTSDAAGHWKINLPAQPAGGPFVMTIRCDSDRVDLKDIAIGDVWLCSGQSNMEHDMTSVYERYANLMDQADFPMIRQFKVPAAYDFNQRHKDLESGSWQPASHDQLGAFTAVGFFFALDLYTKTKVPIGLINASLGGSPIEAWLPEEVIRSFPKDYQELKRFQEEGVISRVEKADQQKSVSWHQELIQKDRGIKGHWKDQPARSVNWKTMSVPGYWADQGLGKVQGAVWFKKEVFVEPSKINAKAKLVLGRMVDADSVFVNGVFVGATGYQYPRRRYALPGHVLRPGINTITIRVVNQSGKGGFVPDKVYALVLGRDTVSLAGLWKYRLGAVMPPAPATTFVRWKPAGLYNAMLAPLFTSPVRGVLWYQGESNAGHPGDYAQKLRALIKTLRKGYGVTDLPFLGVQLPNFLSQTFDANAPSHWAALREQQRLALNTKNTAMAVTMDLGEWNDIHPLNKQGVGRRLALLAESMCYGPLLHLSDSIGHSPLIQRAVTSGSKVILKFKNTDGQLKTREELGTGKVKGKGTGSVLRHFAIAPAGKDKEFVWADAQIHGNEVWVSSPLVDHPARVRYGWADNPVRANLVNKEGLPAAPFEISVEK